jgi:hypothetical protein
MSRIGAVPRTAVPVSNARAEASRKNGAKSRGPKTSEGKARSARNALRHGLRAQKYLVLPEEDAAEFAGLEAALVEELAPVGALQTVLARRVAVAAWRLARADRLEAELFAERSYGDAGPGLALIRDGNGTRSFETLLRYRGVAMAEFMRSLRMLKALQAEQAASMPVGAGATIEPEHCARPRLDALSPDRPEPGSGLHESPATWQPNEPEPTPADQPERLPGGPAHVRSNEPGLAGLGQQVRAAGAGAQRAMPGAITPPRERRNPAAVAQLARSTP